MGTNAAPQIANVYLHVYEYEYIKLLIEKGDKESLKRFISIARWFNSF